MLLFISMMAMVHTMAQTNIVFAGQTSELSVEPVEGDTYFWELYNDVTGLNLAVVPGNCPPTEAFFVGGINTGPVVQVTWLKPGIYFFKVSAWNGCPSRNVEFGKVEVLESLPTAILAVNPEEICVGEWANLAVSFTGTEPWSFKLQITDSNGTTIQEYKEIMASGNPLVIPLSPTLTTDYTVIEVTDAYGHQMDPSNVVKLTVNPLPNRSRIYLKND